MPIAFVVFTVQCCAVQKDLRLCLCDVNAGLLFFTSLFYIASFVTIVLFYIYYAHAVSELLLHFMFFILPGF